MRSPILVSNILLATTTLFSLPLSTAAWGMMPRSLDAAVSVGTHAGAAISAGAEVMDDFESVGHGHGMLLLCASKLCRELNVVREAVAGELEDVAVIASSSKQSPRTKLLLHPIHQLLRLLTHQYFTISLALAGLTAAMMEVLKDITPGGHHGAVLLATNELFELLEASRIARRGSLLLKVVGNQILRLVVVAGATALALLETVVEYSAEKGGSSLGAHHGVLIFGLSKTLRCIGLLRSRFNNKPKEE